MGNLLPLFLLFLFWGGINFSQEVLSEQVRPNKHQSATKDIQETANNEKDNPSQFEIELLKTLRAIADNEKSAYEQNNANAKSWNSPGIIVNIGLLIVGSLYTIFAFLQWRAIRHQAQFMQEGLEISRQSAKAAQDSADAATKSVRIAEAALKLTERAYITVRDWQWSSPEAAHPGTISCFLVNNGRTPAQRISYFVHRIEVGSLATDDYRVQRFRIHENPGYNYNRKKNA